VGEEGAVVFYEAWVAGYEVDEVGAGCGFLSGLWGGAEVDL